jgi:hypothetical protein
MYKAKAAGGNSYVICDDGIVSLTTLKGNSWSQY